VLVDGSGYCQRDGVSPFEDRHSPGLEVDEHPAGRGLWVVGVKKASRDGNPACGDVFLSGKFTNLLFEVRRSLIVDGLRAVAVYGRWGGSDEAPK
jgi:hypothetical protein